MCVYKCCNQAGFKWFLKPVWASQRQVYTMHSVVFIPLLCCVAWVSGNETAALISLEKAGGRTTGKRQVSPAIVQLSDHDSYLNSGECKSDSGQCVCVCVRVLERVGLLLCVDLYPGETSNCGEKRPPEAEDVAWRDEVFCTCKSAFWLSLNLRGPSYSSSIVVCIDVKFTDVHIQGL